MQKNSIKFVIILILLLFIIVFISPHLAVSYINYTYGPEIYVSQVSVSSNLTCLYLHDVNVQKKSISGVITRAEFCYINNTILIDGGEIDLSISNKQIDRDQYPSIQISAKNIDLNVTKGNISANTTRTDIDLPYICTEHGLIENNKYSLIVNNACININTFQGSFEHLITSQGFSAKSGYFTSKNGPIVVQSIENAQYNITAHGISADLENQSVYIDALNINNDKIYSDEIIVRSILIENINIENIKDSELSITIDTSNIKANLKEKKFSGNDTCQNWLNIIPKELKKQELSQIQLTGNFSFYLQLEPVSLKIKNSCKLLNKPEFIQKIKKPFSYTVYHPDGSLFIRESGPGSSQWVTLTSISENMIKALTMTEDPGFFNHTGIIPKALENSLKDNIRLGRFYRGGSTITMQLAKNLWLNRDRSIGRKIQEAVLTIALESSLSKENIIELYLNVVEFGPDTYGIGAGSVSLLGTHPLNLTISEALYLALRLPCPNKHTSYEEKQSTIQRLIDAGIESGKLTEEDLLLEGVDSFSLPW